MKRRNFLRHIGLGTSGLILSGRAKASKFDTEDPGDSSVSKYEDLLNRDGKVLIRITYSSSDPQVMQDHLGRISISKGRLDFIKTYFFNGGVDELDPIHRELKVISYPGSKDVLLLGIAGGSGATKISFPLGKNSRKVTIDEIIQSKDLILEEGKALVNISYLLDQEIGEIDPQSYGIKDPGDKFCFTVMADPQGGDPFALETVQTRMRIHNAFIDESVRLVNELEPKPAFNIVIGDIVDGQGYVADFRAMNNMLFKLKVPALYELGNHETRYNAEFSPGYNMSAFENYFAAQKEFNGMNKLLYSFNLGLWHFIVWPDPLRNNFWETHPHYFHWLEGDLEKHKDRPTIFFQHVPLHPIGILPLINYAESVDVKNHLLNILSSHRNVRYILSGHVHIPMKASVKTAVKINGMQLINLPAAGYRPRAFGEEDFNGGPSQGIAIVEIEGKDARINYKTVTNEKFTYPEAAMFDGEKYPLWLNHKWQLAKKSELQNGSFKEGLMHWHKRYVYHEDTSPSNICESRTDDSGRSFLYLYNRSRGADQPGQDRLPQSINRVCQVLKQTPGTFPLVELFFRIDPDAYLPENHAGAFIWMEGFEKGLKRLNVVYSNDYIHWHLGGDQSQLRTVLPVHIDLKAEPGKWKKLVLNPFLDFLRYTEAQTTFLERTDSFSINLGVWTLNEGFRKEAGAFFTDISVEFRESSGIETFQSNIEGSALEKKEQKYLWWYGVKHPAGEHQSIVEDLNKYLK